MVRASTATAGIAKLSPHDWIHVKTHNVPHLLDELGGLGEFEVQKGKRFKRSKTRLAGKVHDFRRTSLMPQKQISNAATLPRSLT